MSQQTSKRFAAALLVLVAVVAMGAVSIPTGGSGSGGAPTDAKYITQTANGDLSAEQALASLSTGILKNTTTTGVLSIAAAGTDYVAVDAELTALAGLTSAADKGIQFTGSGTAGVYDLTTAGKALLDDANASAQRTTLGLGSMATQSSTNISVSGGDLNDNDNTLTITGATITQADYSGTVSTLSTPLSVANGGSGAATLTGLIYGSGTSALSAATVNGDLRFSGGTLSAKRCVQLLVTDPATAITTGDGKVQWRVPAIFNGYDLVDVELACTTVSSSGAPAVQIRRSRRTNATTRSDADMCSTAPTLDVSEFDSVDAATAETINTSNDDLLTGDMVFVDVDTAGTGCKGLTVTLTIQLP